MIHSLDIDVLNSLTITEFAVLRYVDNNKKEVLKMSIQNLAEKNFVSTTTIIRLCKKLKLSGFSELKFKLKSEIESESILSKDLTLEKIIDNNLLNITNTANKIDKQIISEIISKIEEVDRIHFFGKGLSGALTSYFSKILSTLGINNYLYEDTHIAYIAAEQMTEKDLIFINSLSGNTNQAVRFAQLCKSRNATIITVTANKSSQLSQISDYTLEFSAGKRHPYVADIVSRLPSLFVFDILVESLVTKMHQNN